MRGLRNSLEIRDLAELAVAEADIVRTALATLDLITKLGGETVGFGFVVELLALDGEYASMWQAFELVGQGQGAPGNRVA